MTKRPLSRQWEIPSQFHDISLTVPGTPAHAKCYSYHDGTSVIVSGGGYKCNSAWSESKMKRTSSAKSRMDSNMQLTINSFRQVFPDTSWLLVKSLTFPWQLSNSPTFPDKWSPWNEEHPLQNCNVVKLKENTGILIKLSSWGRERGL